MRIAQLLALGSLSSLLLRAPEGRGDVYSIGEGAYVGSDEFDPTNVSDEDFDEALRLFLGVDSDGDVERVHLSCSKGDLTPELLATDAWRRCQEQTGMSPIEWLAAASIEALKAGDDETGEALAEVGQAEIDKAEAAGLSEDEIGSQMERGVEAGAEGAQL